MEEQKKSNHQVNIVRVDEILTHPNADKLSIIMVGGYQCIVQKDAFKVGDYGIYIQPDSVVPEHKAFEFLWMN